MTDTVKAWQCKGCGRLEGPAQCIGVCEDLPVELVNAADYETALASAARAEGRIARLEEVVRRIALTTPRKGEWERTWRALQLQAKRALEEPAP
jgi:hypothetical protein